MSRGHIVVIGGGQSAKGLLFVIAEYLARGNSLMKSARITIVEKSWEFGTGLAWSRQYALEAHLSSLAEPFSRVSYGDRQQRQFHGTVQLLKEFGVPVALLPGQEAVRIRRTAHAIEVVLISGQVLTAEFVVLANGYWQPVNPHDGQLGYHSTPWPADRLQEAVFDGCYWISNARPKRILVLGTYLNGVDAALSLAFRVGTFRTDNKGRVWFEAPEGLRITLASRSGYLPKVWGRAPAPHPARWFTESMLDQLTAASENAGFLPLETTFKLLARELMAADPTSARLVNRRNRSPCASSLQARIRSLRRWLNTISSAEILRRDIAAVTASGEPWGSYANAQPCVWQSVLFSALPVCSEYSHAFCAEDQAFFDREIRTLFFNYAMPMTLDNAVRLEAMMQSGHLDVLALGPTYTCRSSPDRKRGMVVLFIDRTGRPCQLYFTDIVNALGQCADIRRHPSVLVQGLLRDGLVQPAIRAFRNPEAASTGSHDMWQNQNIVVQNGKRYLVTGGMYVNPKLCELIPKGQSESSYAGVERATLYTMGPNVMGQFLDAQSIGQIERDAHRIVDAISRKLLT